MLITCIEMSTTNIFGHISIFMATSFVFCVGGAKHGLVGSVIKALACYNEDPGCVAQFGTIYVLWRTSMDIVTTEPIKSFRSELLYNNK